MNCPFCQCPCVRDRWNQLSDGLVGWECDRHAHPVHVIEVPSKRFYSFYYTVWRNHREYTIECYKLPGNDIFVPEETLQLRNGTKLILEIPFIPKHITPDNIDDKLPALLIFL